MQFQTKVLQVEGINAAALLHAVEDLLNRKISSIQKPAPESEAEFLTRQQVADLFGVTLPTIHAWTNAGILAAYKIANKTRFKKNEVMAACKPLNGKKEVSHAG